MALWPKPDDKKKQMFIRSAMAKLNEVGLVGIHDAGVTPGNLELYKTLAKGDDWTVRVYASKQLHGLFLSLASDDTWILTLEIMAASYYIVPRRIPLF